MFLFEGSKKYFLVTIHVNVESSRFEAILSQVSPAGAEEIMKQKLPDSFDPENWNHFTLGLVSSKFFMVLNKKDLVFDMLDLPQSDDKQGTIGVGINGMKAEFSDIQMDCMLKDAFVKYIESLRKKGEITVDEITEEDMEKESAALEPENPNISADGQLIPTYDPCVSITKQELRVQWIVDNVNPTNLAQVEFCPSCCGVLATPNQNDDCMTQCMGAITPAPPASDLFDKCLAGDKSLALVEQLTECKLCVEDLKKSHPEVEDNVYVLKKAECDTKFKSCDNPLECTGSLAKESEAE